MLLAGPALAGQYGGGSTSVVTTVETLAEREIERRQLYLNAAHEAIVEGDKAMKVKDYETAFAQYRLALDALPQGVAEVAGLRKEAMKKFCDAGVRLAEQRVAEGRFGDAETLVRLVLEDRYAPECGSARQLLVHLNDPEYFNQTLTPKFIGDVEEVKKLLREGRQMHMTGRYDLAMKRYDQALNLDPYNIAARKGQEEVNKSRSEYGIDARNEARSRLLWQVEKAWQSRVRNYKTAEVAGPEAGDAIADNQALMNKLSRIIIPQIQFRDATVREAVEFLKQKSVELDTSEPDPLRRGVNIVLKLEPTASYGGPGASGALAEPAIPGLEAPVDTGSTAPTSSIDPSEARITLSLRNIPMMEALNYIANLAGLKVKVDPYAVAIVPQSEPIDVLVTKEYRVPPTFIPNEAAGSSAPTGAFGASAGEGGTGISTRAVARAYLEQQGVQFPAGASANFLPSSSRLIVRNTQPNIDLIDTLVIAASQGGGVSQVEIEAKFVEVTQNNLKELGFDWLLGQSNIPGGDADVFFGGGTAGTSAPINAADFPFVAPGGIPVGGSPVTGGLRSGNTGISANAIDALLFNVVGNSALAPGIFALAGVFTDPQFQLVIRALNQKKGVDLLSAPRVTTKSGQRAVIDIVRELRYPTEFDPPQIPQETGNNNFALVGGVLVQQAQSTPVTPTTPTAFETRNTGVTLEVEPVVGPDGYTIDLNLVPQVVEFEGFVNYGSPIQTSSVNVLGITNTVVLTPNQINQPIFSTRKVTTSVSIWDGQTVMIGGLMREDVQKIEDKVPLLGDLPLIGRLFRSQIDQNLKRNLVIFVTARLMNPAGEPILYQEEEEVVIETLAPPEISPPMLPEAPIPGYYK